MSLHFFNWNQFQLWKFCVVFTGKKLKRTWRLWSFYYLTSVSIKSISTLLALERKWKDKLYSFIFLKLSISDFHLTSRMSKRQKLSFFPLGDLPDEILLKIFSYMNIKGVLQCGKVSMRFRAISNDQSLWLKLNLYQGDVPYGFIETAIQNGYEYLEPQWL